MNTRPPKGQPNRHIPAGTTAISREGVDAIVYVYTSSRGHACAMFYGGQRSMPDKHLAYRNEAQRAADIDGYLDAHDAYAQRKAAEAAERKAYRHSFKVGDIFSYSWGYDQTNVEFYQVVSTTEKTVTVREIASKPVPNSGGFMCDQCVPCPGTFLDDAKPLVKRPQPSSDGRGLLPFDFGVGTPWDGSPEYRSWYA
jgi:hypothetical protein